MTQNLKTRDVGMIRIYMKPSDKGKAPRKFWFFGTKPLYRELVAAAKNAGIMNAIVHHTHYGYSNHGSIQPEGYEEPNPHLTMCVELICERERLDRFCRDQAEALQGKAIVFQALENWSVTA